MAKREETHFVVTYKEPKEGKVVSIKARTIRDSSLGPAFVEISDFVFDDNPLIVDVTAENFKDHFINVKKLHLGIYHIVSIEEVGKHNKGLSLKKEKSNVVVLENPKN